MGKNKETGSKASLGSTGTKGSQGSLVDIIEAPSDIILTAPERKYLLYVQRGDVGATRRQLEEYEDKKQELDINCHDPLGRSALGICVENENLNLIELLLEKGIKPKDALLHAIAEEYVEGVEVLLEWEEKTHQKGTAYSWENMTADTAAYTRDITPLILAAHRDHYEILKLLLDRGASLPMPHDIRCGCDECITSTEEDSLRHSLARINAYRALASPSLIALSSKDPVRTAFELSGELARLRSTEHEFSTEYTELQMQVEKFVAELLEQTRTRKELAIVLNYQHKGSVWEEGTPMSLDRLKLAIKFEQKKFVAHPNVQQLLGSIWYDGLPGFRRKDMLGQLINVAKLSCMFPVFSMAYIINPNSEGGKFMKHPFVKFICHCASYMFFLMLLALASQRIEMMLIQLFGTAWMREWLMEWKMKERGSIPYPVELLIICYIFSLVWAEIKSLWNDGLFEYIKDLWNIVDYTTNMFFMTWIMLRFTAFILVQKDLLFGNIFPFGTEWENFDKLPLPDSCSGNGITYNFLKLVHIFSVNPHLGPLQISLGRMIFDIMKFFVLYTLVLFAFGCGKNQLMWYYAELEMQKCYHLPGGLPDIDHQAQSCFIWRRFANLFETSQSLFWASFGLVDLDSFELVGVGEFTRFWAMLMFGSYSVINIIVLLNLLIAMMSNSFMIISERSDTEWKFARTKLWLSYFEDGGTVPPPFNVIPTPKGIMRALGIRGERVRGSMKQKTRKLADIKHMNVMRLLVRRYVTERQRKADEKEVTEDDINEVKQDISTFRFELIDILKNNGMNTSMADDSDGAAGTKKARAMERRLMKGFNIGMVEGVLQDIVAGDKKPKNIFGKLAKAMKKKKSVDWNSRVSKASLKRDQIGSSRTSLNRSQTSLRRRIKMENEILLKTYDPEKILDYNPNLESHTPQTRIAYAKFKVGTLKKDKEKSKQDAISNNVNQKAGAANQAMANDKAASPAQQYKPPSRQPTPAAPTPAPAAASPPPRAASPPPPRAASPPPPRVASPPPPRSPSPEPRAISPPPPRTITPTGLARPVGPPAPRPLSPPPGKVKVPTAFTQATDQGGLSKQVSPSHRPRPVIIPPSAQTPSQVVLKKAPPRQAPKPVPVQAPAVIKLKPVPPPSPAPKDIPKMTVTNVSTPAPDKPTATAAAPPAKPDLKAHAVSDTSISEGKSIVTGQVRTGWL
ncbi:unnamed protein product, partial [Meganyctiphanes norvegica]